MEKINGVGIDPTESQEGTAGEQLDQEPIVDETTDTQETDSEAGQTEGGTEEQTIEINGEQVPVTEVQKGYMRQQDYTRKAQELSNDRRLFEQSRALDRPQERQEQGQTLTPEQQQAREMLKQMGVAFADDIAPTKKELTAIRKEFEEREDDREADRQVNELKTKYGMEEQQISNIIDFAVQEGIPTLELAYKAMVYDQKITEAKQAGKAETAKTLKQRKEKMVESGQATTKGSSTIKYDEGDSYEDLLLKGEQLMN